MSSLVTTNKIMKHYGLKNEDLDEMLEELAFKTNKLQSGGRPDLDAAARMVLKDWQTGKIKTKTFKS